MVAVLVVYFSLLAALGGHARWGRLGVPPLSPPFADMRSVTSGWECTRRGIAVLPTNPCDPYNHRPANYPRIWMWPSFLGLGQGATVALGLAVAAVFFVAALAVLPRAAGAADGLAYGLAVCAPAVMLGVERGNVDLALFALVVLAVLLLRGGRVARWAAHGLILLAAILKLFPIFAAAVLVRQPRRRAMAGLAVVLGSFGLYALLTLGTIREIGGAVPQFDTLSFGIRRLTEWLWAVSAPSPLQRLSTRGLDLVLAAVVLAAALLVRVVRPRLLPPDDRSARRDLDLFYAGAAVYACSYVFFRSWDYRLVFLLLTVPQFLRWARAGRALAIIGLLGLFGTLWLDAWHAGTTPDVLHQPLPAAVVAQFAVFACCVAGLVGTWPLGTER